MIGTLRRLRGQLGAWTVAMALALGATSAAVPNGTAAAVSCRINITRELGDRGDAVLCIERRLLELGYMSTNIDTYFGTTTRDGVKRFRADRGIGASGIVGPTTASALGIRASNPVRTHHPIEARRIATSVNGHDLIAYRYGSGSGKPVVAMGQIHGNEPGGAMIAAYLRVRGAPQGVDLWVVDTVNPDGWRAYRRTNARLVDLNRNFSSGNWVYGGAGTGTYSGPSAASEPETRAVQTFLRDVRPRLMIVWHQVGAHVDDNRSVANYELLRRYAQLTGYPIRSTPSCTTCGGTATSYVNRKIGTSAFTVEMPSTFSYTTAKRHGDAFLQTALES